MVTQEQLDNRTSNYVCWDCGDNFLTEEQKYNGELVEVFTKPCGLCGETCTVSHVKNFNWLNEPQEPIKGDDVYKRIGEDIKNDTKTRKFTEILNFNG